MLAPNTLNNAFGFYCCNLKHTEIWDYIGKDMRELRNSEEKIIFFQSFFTRFLPNFHLLWFNELKTLQLSGVLSHLSSCSTEQKNLLQTWN